MDCIAVCDKWERLPDALAHVFLQGGERARVREGVGSCADT